MNIKAPAYSDKFLQENTKTLVERFDVDHIYETGTFRGGSTLILGRMFPDFKIYTYEINRNNTIIAATICKDNSNICVRNISSVEGLNEDVLPNKSNVLFFLDAHWGNYWPLKDELKVIASKGIYPVIIVHDFFVPNKSGGAKFKFDTYKGQPLNLNFIKDGLDSIYDTGYDYHYSDKVEVNSGVFYAYPKARS